MGKKDIEEKERNIIGEKDRKREEDTRKGNRFPAGHKHVASGENTHIECQWKLQQI